MAASGTCMEVIKLRKNGKSLFLVVQHSQPHYTHFSLLLLPAEPSAACCGWVNRGHDTNGLLGGRNSSVGSAWVRCPQRRGFDPPLGTFSVEGIFPLELTWVQTPFPQTLLRMRV